MLLEQLTLFSNVSIVLEDADTHRSKKRRRINNSATRRQSHVIAGTVPESTDARTQGRPWPVLAVATCLVRPTPMSETRINTDASDTAVDAVLQQHIVKTQLSS